MSSLSDSYLDSGARGRSTNHFLILVGKKCGDTGDRTPDLSHAKRTLYHWATSPDGRNNANVIGWQHSSPSEHLEHHALQRSTIERSFVPGELFNVYTETEYECFVCSLPQVGQTQCCCHAGLADFLSWLEGQRHLTVGQTNTSTAPQQQQEQQQSYSRRGIHVSDMINFCKNSLVSSYYTGNGFLFSFKMKFLQRRFFFNLSQWMVCVRLKYLDKNG